jgi:two-component system, cell cycle sensor histidine kinase and response regulator CckA
MAIGRNDKGLRMSDRVDSKHQGQGDVEFAQDVYRSLMDQSVMAMMVSQGMPPRLVVVNRAYSEMLGYPEDELLAMPPEELAALIHSEDVVRAMGVYQAALEGSRERAVAVFRFIRRDGAVRWMDATGSAVRFRGEAAVLILCSDITERKESEAALRDSERKYRLLAENASDIIWTMDLEFNATYVSPSEARLRGLPLEEVRGHRFDQRMTPESIERASAGMKSALEAEMSGEKGFPVTGEMDLMCADGSALPTETTVSLVRDDDGRPVGYVGVTRDITQRKRAEEERIALEAQIQRSQKLDSLGLLVGGVAHDFNNLLHGLMTNMSVVRRDLVAGSVAMARLDDMDTGTHQAADLCRQMLAYAGKGRVNAEPVNLNTAISEMAGLLATSMPLKGRLQQSLDGEVPTLLADVSQLRQVVMNLVSNGAEALGSGGGLVSLSTGIMRCDPEFLAHAALGGEATPGRFVFVEVADDGCGMDPETASRMFEPFFSTKFTGRGLGLAAVLGIVRAHRGAVNVDSVPGRGTRVRVVLPILARIPPPEVASEPEVAQIDGAGRLVLVVDDDRLSREGLELVLIHRGFEVITAAGGQAALEVVEARGMDLAVVLLDLTMPDLDGVETFQRLRVLREDLPVVLCTGYGMDEAVDRFGGDQVHLAGFLHKPYTPQTLLAQLREILE